LGEIGGVGVEVIWVAADLLSLIAKENGMERFVDKGGS
jgi:hypothetical protein